MVNKVYYYKADKNYANIINICILVFEVSQFPGTVKHQ